MIAALSVIQQRGSITPALAIRYKTALKMVVIHNAYTEPINPPGATPVLTRDQIWRGLQRKIRKAQDFVPVIHKTDVLEEKADEVIRIAYFKWKEDGPETKVKERCVSFYPTKVSMFTSSVAQRITLTNRQVDFHQPDGALITNTVSDGPSGEENDFMMTYTFEWRHPHVKEGSEEHHKLVEERRRTAKMAVHSSIERMRKMAADGELDG